MLPKGGILSLKLTRRHLNRRHIFFYIKSLSVHPLLWMNVMLDFICIGFTKLSATGSKQKIQNENICLRVESNLRPLLSTPLWGQLKIVCKTFSLLFYATVNQHV